MPPPRPIELPKSNKLNVKPEDLETLEEIGSGNGGTVNRVRYRPTGAIMARKVGRCPRTDATPSLRRTKKSE